MRTDIEKVANSISNKIRLQYINIPKYQVNDFIIKIY